MIKRLFFITIMFILGTFLIITMSDNVYAAPCIPDSNLYDKCHENTGTYTSAKLQISLPRGVDEVSSHPYLQKVKINYKCEATKLYIYENFISWDDLDLNSKCDFQGCDGGQELSLEGEYIIRQGSGEYQNVGKRAFVCWDQFIHSDGRISVIRQSRSMGIVAHAEFTAIVGCREDSHCSSNQYCDRTSIYTFSESVWQCKIKQCEIGQEKCVGTDLFICSNKYVYENTGKVDGMCGYATLTLDNNTLSINNTCQMELWQVENNQCTSFTGCSGFNNEQSCIDSLDSGIKCPLYSPCQLGTHPIDKGIDKNGCILSICVDDEKGNNIILYIVGGLVSVIIILFIVFMILRRKRKVRT